MRDEAEQTASISPFPWLRYLAERARIIHLPRGRCKDSESSVTPEENTAMRGYCGKLNWTAREGMPNGPGDASLLSSTLSNPEVKGLIEASAALRRLKDANATITVKSMPFSRLRLVASCDSGLDVKGGGQGRSQTGNVIRAVDQRRFGLHRSRRQYPDLAFP